METFRDLETEELHYNQIWEDKKVLLCEREATIV